MEATWRCTIVSILVALAGCSSSSENNPAGAAGSMMPPPAAASGGAGGIVAAGAPSMVMTNPIMGAAGNAAAGSGGMSAGMNAGAGGNANTTAGMGGAAGTPDMMAGGMGAAGDDMAGSSSDAGTASTDPGFKTLPHVMSTDGPGPFNGVVKVKNTPPGGWLIYPMEIGKDGIKHPIFIFGPGGGTTPDTYETMGMHWDRYGSYGFVIYVLPMSTGDGAAMTAGLDWVIAQNDDSKSPLYQHLDTSKVCAAGHSQGSITTFDFMPDDRVTTTIHISGGSFDGMGPSHLRHDTMFMCAPDSSGDPAKPQCDGDFANSKVPTFYTVVQGASHLTSARLGWGASIAWMLWHLAGHEEWRKEFLEPDGEFQTGIYQSQIKNW